MLPCKSSCCCWRWAACKLIDECQAASVNAVYFRRVLEEELGDSALQKLIGLEQEHSALAADHQKLLQALQAERRHCRALEEEKENLRLTAEEARFNEETAVSKQLEAEDAVQKLEERCRKQRKDLEQLKQLTPEVLQAKIKEKEDELAKERADREEKEAELSKELHEVEGHNLALRMKLKQLEALEGALQKKKMQKKKGKRK